MPGPPIWPGEKKNLPPGGLALNFNKKNRGKIEIIDEKLKKLKILECSCMFGLLVVSFVFIYSFCRCVTVNVFVCPTNERAKARRQFFFNVFGPELRMRGQRQQRNFCRCVTVNVFLCPTNERTKAT